MSKKYSDDEFEKMFTNLVREASKSQQAAFAPGAFAPLAEMAYALYTDYNDVGFMPEQAFDLTVSTLEMLLAKAFL